MAYVNGKNSNFTFSNNHGFTFRVNWSEAYDISSNTSIVTIDSLEMKSTSYNGTWWVNLLIKVDDITVAEMNYDTPTHRVTVYPDGVYKKIIAFGTGVASQWKSNPIVHNTDGSKKVNISIVPNPAGHNLSRIQIYRQEDDFLFTFDDKIESIDLTHIPRSSSFTLSSYVIDAGDNIMVDIQRASDDFTHTVEFYINDTYYQKYTNVGAYQTYTIPMNWCNAMPSSTSCSAYCQVTTYKGETQIGNPSRSSFTVNVPSSIVPSIGLIALDPIDINNNNILIKGKNSLQISVSNCSAGIGSSIKSYTFVGPSVSQTVSNTSDNASILVQAIQIAGELTYDITITDARGRTVTQSSKIICYDYFTPYFSMFDAYRTDENGVPNVNGSYLKCVYEQQYASVNSTNSTNVTVVYNDKTTEDTLININDGADTTYRVYLIITDEYGGKNTSNVVTVFGKTRIFNITQDGTGVAIGKIAESGNLFECRWPAQFGDTINCKNIMINQQSIVDLIYPVGSVYISVNEGDTCDLTFGTWVKLNTPAITGVYMWERIE
jgi:hypothetical protein